MFNPVVEGVGVQKRKLEIFSTDPQLVYPPEGRARNIFILQEIRNKPQFIPICLNSRTHGLCRARVSVVDMDTREPIETFLVEIDAEKPQIDQAVSIQCTLGQQNFYKMKFKNPFTDSMAIFNITSSNPGLVQPKKAIEKFQPKEEKELCFFLPQ